PDVVAAGGATRTCPTWTGADRCDTSSTPLRAAPLERLFLHATVASATKMTTWATMETKAMRRMSWGMPAVMGLSQPRALSDPFLMRTQRVGHHAELCNARLLDAVHDLHHRRIGHCLMGSEKACDPGILVMQRLQPRLEQAQRDRI